jgi:protein-tyrosine sulfotransferase
MTSETLAAGSRGGPAQETAQSRSEATMTTSFPLFIVSGPRSGSTLLRYILDTHSQIASPGEIGLGALCEALNRVVRFTLAEATPALSPEERNAMAVANVRELVSGVMSSYLALKGKRIWCDKSIDNTYYLEYLAEAFPEARFICLHRDCLDFVHSCLECSHNGFMDDLCRDVVRQPDNLVGAMVVAWMRHTRESLTLQEEHPERCFPIKYEDLVTAPEASLRPLLAFAGVEWEDDLLASVFTAKHDQGGGDSKIRFMSRIDPASVGSGQRVNQARISDETRREADALLARLSYPPLTPGRRLPWVTAGGGPAAAPDDVASPAPPSIEAFLQHKLSERPEAVAAIRGSCKLVLQGQGGGSWTLDFNGDAPTVSPHDGEADCCLTGSVADFHDVIFGRANPVVAVWSHRIAVDGDIRMAFAVGKLLNPAEPGPAEPPPAPLPTGQAEERGPA